MSRKASRDRRMKFFGLGNTHRPICLVPFTEDDVRTGRGVTLEHAPPRTVGGREVCLTCEPCNRRASATSDQAVKRTNSPPEVEIETSGIRRRARFWPDGIPPSRMPYRFGGSPAAKEAQRELSKETIVVVTGLGADMGGGLAFADPRHELVFEARARVLVRTRRRATASGAQARPSAGIHSCPSNGVEPGFPTDPGPGLPSREAGARVLCVRGQPEEAEGEQYRSEEGLADSDARRTKNEFGCHGNGPNVPRRADRLRRRKGPAGHGRTGSTRRKLAKPAAPGDGAMPAEIDQTLVLP